MRPSGVAKLGNSQSYCLATSGVAPGISTSKGSSCALTSTMRTTSTSPIFHFLMCSTAMAFSSGLLAISRWLKGRKRRPPQDHIRSLLGNHHHGRIRVSAHKGRKDRGIGDPQSIDTPDLEFGSDDRGVVNTHTAASGRMKDGCSGSTEITFERVIAFHVWTRQKLGPLVAGESRGCEYPACQPEAAHKRLEVFGHAQNTWIDNRRCTWIRT